MENLEYKYMGSCCMKNQGDENRGGTEGTGRKKPTLVRSEIPKLSNRMPLGRVNQILPNINIKNNHLVRHE